MRRHYRADGSPRGEPESPSGLDLSAVAVQPVTALAPPHLPPPLPGEHRMFIRMVPVAPGQYQTHLEGPVEDVLLCSQILGNAMSAVIINERQLRAATPQAATPAEMAALRALPRPGGNGS